MGYIEYSKAKGINIKLSLFVIELSYHRCKDCGACSFQLFNWIFTYRFRMPIENE